MNEQDVRGLTTVASDLGDLMLTVEEHTPSGDHAVPARLMSDGTLRFLAILTSVLQAPSIDTMPERLASEDAVGQTTVVIEELENGLHASQARKLVKLVRSQVARRRVRALATVHSPAVLNAITGDEHRNVVVCVRDGAGRSSLTRLVDLPNYWRIATATDLGTAAVADKLRPEVGPSASAVAHELDQILGAS